MRKALSAGFFDHPTVSVAKGLLGKFLVVRWSSPQVRQGRDRIEAFMITEVEAYDGFHDKASHAARGKTKRNAPMFSPSGHWYVYFTYGMHWMLNIVTGKKGYPAAVLIRALAPCHVSPVACRHLQGPARLTKKLKIDGKFDDLPANRKTGLWIEDGGFRLVGEKIYPPKFSAGKLGRMNPPSPSPPAGLAGLRKGDSLSWRIKKSPRIGVHYAGKYWAGRHYRFFIG